MVTKEKIAEYLSGSIYTPIDDKFLSMFKRSTKWVDKKTGDKYKYSHIEEKENKLMVICANISSRLLVAYGIELKDFLEDYEIDLSDNI